MLSEGLVAGGYVSVSLMDPSLVSAFEGCYETAEGLAVGTVLAESDA